MLGEWLRKAMDFKNISGAELGRRLTEELGRSIDRAAVSKMRNGDRAIAGDELFAISKITGFQPPTTKEYIEEGVVGPIGNVVPLDGYVGAGAQITVADQSEALEEIEVQWSLKEPMVAFEIVGTSMVPVYRPGFAIICYREGRQPNSMLGEEVVVRLSDGRRFLKRLRRGSKRNRYNLESFNTPDPIEDVAVAWVGAIHVIVPPREFRKIRRMRGG